MRDLGNRGFAMMYVLLLITVSGFLTVAILPRCVSWYHAALVQYETDCLVSNLRLLQQMSRTAVVYPANEGEADDILTVAKPELEFRDKFHQYRITRMGRSEAGLPQRQNLVIHSYPPAITVASSNAKGTIDFGRNGETKDIMTIAVCYENEQQRGKDVIIDIAGRIRVEQHHEK
ncbi:MAG: hypothetical protein SPL39_02435 [Selenomonadaceae bacterium]|nr:hypothetical protein [Selenomonadaceae bacterium]